MKKFLSILSLLIFAVSLASCENETAIEVSEISESVAEEVNTETIAEVTAEPVDNIPTLQECRKTVTDSDNYSVSVFSLTAECSGNIREHANAEETDIKITGRIAILPIKLTYDENISNAVISFTYEKTQLHGAPESNLIMLHYNEDKDDYDIIDSVLDTENRIIKAEISEDGIYMVADIYHWYMNIGLDNSEYEYEYKKGDLSTYWENEYDTGDIMRLADKEWALENAPEFHVSTSEQLASVVWYANAAEMTEINLTLEDDIDLTGYEWKSMNWQYTGNEKIDFKGFVEGNGHTINGMKIHENDCYDVGFLGFAVNTSMQNISFTNADVSADYAVGIAAGKLYADEKAEIEWKNVHVSGKVSAYDGYGAVAGFGDHYWYAPFTDCTADVEVNGEPFEYLTFDEKEEADRIALQDTFTITLHDDGTITRDEHDGFIDLGWTVVKNNASCELPLDAVENPVYSIDEAIAPYYTGRHPHPKGTYEIYLMGRTDPNKHTQRVSNVIEYHLEGDDFR